MALMMDLSVVGKTLTQSDPFDVIVFYAMDLQSNHGSTHSQWRRSEPRLLRQRHRPE